MKFDNDSGIIFHVQIVIGHRNSGNKCFVMYRMNAAKNGAACPNTSQLVKLKASVAASTCFPVMM